MIKFFLILSALLSQNIFFLNHIADEVFDGNVVTESSQNCAKESDNGDYCYEISSDLNNPTITFIPLNGNAGTPTCILYYGTGTGTYPGFPITPNVPYQINASQGAQINFYFTYSYNGGERNNSNNPYSFTVGECASSDATYDATLSSISINNTPLSGFSAQTMSYTYSLPIGETNVPTVSVSTSNANATYSINDASSIPGTTTITVVSEDTTQTKTYSITFQQSSYALVWSDEFDDDGTTYISGVDNAIDDSKWFHQTKLPNGWGWYNDEQQHYTNRIDNSYVSDGTLKIVAKKETFTDQGHTKQYTSARLNSKFAFTYGVVEIRAKLPTGVGSWPAIWTLGKNINESGAYWQQQHGSVLWPACGEIDIMEHWGSNQNFIQSAMHTPSSSGNTFNKGGRTISTVSSEFHVYKLEWTAEKMIFSVDDIEHYIYNPSVKDASTWPFNSDQYLLLNIAIQESIAPSFTSSAMEIDYIRVYQEQPLSIDQNNPLVEIQLYPNPASKQFFIDSTKDIDEVNIYDLHGRLVVQRRPMQKEISIVEDLSKGVYLVEIKALDLQSTRRLIVK